MAETISFIVVTAINLKRAFVSITVRFIICVLVFGIQIAARCKEDFGKKDSSTVRLLTVKSALIFPRLSVNLLKLITQAVMVL